MAKKDKKKENDNFETLCVIRVRGAPGMKRKVLFTLKLLNLHKQNHCTLVRNDPSTKGMIQKAKDYIAFGNPSKEMIKKLLEKRARLVGNKPLTNNHIRFSTVYGSISELAGAIQEGKVSLKEIKDLKPVFRLHPPKGGYPGTVKKPIGSGGALGNVGEKIDLYLNKMI